MKVLYFAWLREKAGCAEEDIALPEGVKDVAGLIAWMQTRGEGFAHAFADTGVVRVAVNQEHVGPDCILRDNDEVAFFPPVTGG